MMKQKWSDVSDEPISEEAVRAMHVPEEIYTFDAQTQQAGQSFTLKAGNDFILYVLSGACKTTMDGNLLQLAAGEFLFLGKGAYQFKSDSAGDVRLVRVSARA
jgi:glyoxylate utilization-related uncharacterized protein